MKISVSIHIQVMCIAQLLEIGSFCHAAEPTKAINGIAYSCPSFPEPRAAGSVTPERYQQLARLLHIQTCMKLKGHAKGVTCLSYNPAGTQLATGSFNTVRLWDPQTGQLLRVLEGHADWVTCLSYNPEGTQLATGSKDRTICLWNLQTGQPPQVLNGHAGGVRCLNYNSAGTQLATGSYDDTVRIWDPPLTGKPTQVLEGHADGAIWLSYNPAGTQLATCSFNTVRIWDPPQTGKPLQVLKGHTNMLVNCLSYNPAGTQLATGSDDHTVYLWDPQTGKLLQILKGHYCSVSCLSYNPAGTQLATGSADTTIRLWYLSDDKSIDLLLQARELIDRICFNMEQGKQPFINGGSEEERQLVALPADIQERLKEHVMIIPADWQCPICLKGIAPLAPDDIQQLACDPRHIFHLKCIARWIAQGGTCLLCRK